MGCKQTIDKNASSHVDKHHNIEQYIYKQKKKEFSSKAQRTISGSLGFSVLYIVSGKTRINWCVSLAIRMDGNPLNVWVVCVLYIMITITTIQS